MLRIERLNEDDATVTLKLDGRIVGQWVAILKKECFQVLKRQKQLILNFADVTFIGREGVEILEKLKRPGKVDWRHSWRAQSEAGSFAGSFAVPWNRAVRPSKKGHRPRRVKNESDVRGALTKTTAPTERDSGVREKGLE